MSSPPPFYFFTACPLDDDVVAVCGKDLRRRWRRNHSPIAGQGGRRHIVDQLALLAVGVETGIADVAQVAEGKKVSEIGCSGVVGSADGLR